MSEDSGARLSRAVHETLDTLVSPTVRNVLIEDALRRGGMKALPADPTEMQKFIRGPLRRIAVEVLGAELGDSIAEEIQRVLRGSGRPRRLTPAAIARVGPGRPFPTRRTPPPSAPDRSRRPSSPGMRRGPSSAAFEGTPPTPRAEPPKSELRSPGGPTPPATVSEYFRHVVRDAPAVELGVSRPPSVAPRVLVSTTDTTFLDKLSSQLAMVATVEPVRSLFALVSELSGPSASRVFIVIDCEHVAIRPTAVAALSEELDVTQVVLCRSTASDYRSMRAISSAVESWQRFERPILLDELVANCEKLVC